MNFATLIPEFLRFGILLDTRGQAKVDLGRQAFPSLRCHFGVLDDRRTNDPLAKGGTLRLFPFVLVRVRALRLRNQIGQTAEQ